MEKVFQTTDANIREELIELLYDEFSYDESTVIKHEMNVFNGNSRIDIAVLNGNLIGYEIKSDKDTLDRLPRQIKDYNTVFDYIYLVCGKKHLKEASSLIPEFWGVYVAQVFNSKIHLIKHKDAIKNKNLDIFALLQFLWKDEIIKYMLDKGYHKKIRYKSKYNLGVMLDEDDKVESIQPYILKTLKNRLSLL